MKNLISICLGLFLLLELQAQQIGITAEYGISTTGQDSKILYHLEDYTVYNYTFQRSSSTPILGMTLSDENEILWAQATVGYAERTNHYSVKDETEDFLRAEGTTTIESKMRFIPLSVAGGVKIGKVRLGVGPRINFHIGDNLKSSEELPAVITKRKSISKAYGFQLLLGYNPIENMQIFFKRSVDFMDVGSDFEFEGVPIEVKRNNGQISLGLTYFI